MGSPVVPDLSRSLYPLWGECQGGDFFVFGSLTRNTVSAKINKTVEVNNIAILYERTVKNITMILRRRYKLTASEAEEAVSQTPLESIFQSDAEMAAHTSNEAWAKEVLAYWLKTREKKP